MSTGFGNLVLYRVKKGKEAEFLPLIKGHAPALKKSGLITSDGVKAWSAKNIRDGSFCYAELFSWKDRDGGEVAHQSPDIMKVWEPMTPLLDKLEILALQPIES
jgi:hypothetical protein